MRADPGGAVARTLRRAARLTDPDAPADGRLLVRFRRAGDEAAFAELVRRHGPMVLGVCRRVAGNHADADDAFQAAFLVLVRRAPELTGRATVGDFLYGVAVRTALKARATAVRRRQKEARAARPEAAPAVADESDRLAALDRELARLPEKYRAALVLCELEGRPRKDVAALLGIPEGTLSSRLAAGRKLLADRLRPYGLALPAGGLVAVPASAVPPNLVDTTIRSAAVSAGHAAGAVPAAANHLAAEVARTMFLLKLRAGALVLAAALVGSAAGLVGLSSAVADQPADKPTPGENLREVAAQAAKDLTGTWELQSTTTDGVTVKPDEPAWVDGAQQRWQWDYYRLTFAGQRGRVDWKPLEEEQPDGKAGGGEFVFTVNPTTDPPQMNWVLTQTNGLVLLIYKLDGDTLTLARHSGSELERPKGFDHKDKRLPAQRLNVSVYKRTKGDVPKPAADDKPTVKRLVDAERTATKDLTGTWELTTRTIDGVELKPGGKARINGREVHLPLKYQRWTFGDRTVRMEYQWAEGVEKAGETHTSDADVTVNPTTAPPQVNIYSKGFLLLGLYKLDGDTLTFATHGISELERPKGFDHADKRIADLPLIVDIYKRVKKDDPKPKGEAKPKPPADPAPDDRDRVQGLWRVVPAEIDPAAGRQPDAIIRRDLEGRARVRIEADWIVIAREGGGWHREFTYTLDPTADPKRIDMTETTRNGGRQHIPGIYKFDGDRLLICADTRGAGQRPTEFKGTARVELMTLERVKDDTPVPADDRPAWRQDFDRVYALKAGEVVKRVPPPYPASRADFWKDYYKGSPHARDTDKWFTVFRYADGKVQGGPVQMPVKPEEGVALSVLLGMCDFPAQTVEGDDDLLAAKVTGDFVLRAGADPAKVAAALGKLLQDIGVPATLTVRDEEREVIVLKGKWASKPLDGKPKDHVELYSRTLIERPGGGHAGGGSGTLAAFVGHLQNFVNQRVVNEVEAAPKGEVSWRLNVRSPMVKNPATGEDTYAEDTAAGPVLLNVCAQTGLTFVVEKRKVPVLTVRRVVAAPPGVNPKEAAREHINRGMGLYRDKRYDAAIAEFSAAIALTTTDPFPYKVRGKVYSDRDDLKNRRPDAAVADYTKALGFVPDEFGTRFNRAQTYRQWGKPDEAIADLTRIIDGPTDFSDFSSGRDGGLEMALRARSEVYDREKKDYGRAITDYTRLIELGKPAGALAARGRCYRATKEFAKAAADFAVELKARPDDHDYRLTEELARLLATCPDPKVRDGRRAVELADKARVLTAGGLPNVLDTLAAAHAEAGDFAAAAEWQRKAIGLLRPEEADARKGMEARLELYRSGKPYRVE